nr:eukaryotic translation initiation factor ncbp [Quercus suber]
MEDGSCIAANAASPVVGATTSTSNIASPARGAEMRDFLQARLQKNRAPPLVHGWDFYHDRQDRNSSTSTSTSTSTSSSTSTSTPAPTYAQRLEHLATITDVRHFWSVFNNFPLTALALRDSIHLFHAGVQPLWEHPRNVRGGSWTFRVARSHAAEFWQDVCLMAIGEQLQGAVTSARTTFRDDICGVSLSVRFNSVLVQVWNRDAEHEEGVQRLREVVLAGLREDLRPKEGSFYYKRHCEHAGFAAEGKSIGGGDKAD